MYLQHLQVCYLDLGSAKQKDYTNIKGVLDKALTGFAAKTVQEKKGEAASRAPTQPSSRALTSQWKIVR
jgi:hypothetical protein